jgi:hypothetical protein
MEKITTSELEEMIRNKFTEKGVSESDVTAEILNNISSKIKEEVNKNKSVENISNAEIKDDSNEQTPEENVEPKEIQQTFNSEETSYRDGELDERERVLAEKEAELIRREQELLLKEKDLEYQPEIPQVIENVGCEDFFIFDENQLSVGAEKLSNTEFNLIDSPEEKTTMRAIWLKDGKKEANVFKVNFEKIGCIKFEPFEGISTFENHSEMNDYSPSLLDKEAEYLASNPIIEPENIERTIDVENQNLNFNNSNMSDYVEPIKNVAQPLIKTDEIEQDLQQNNLANIPSIENIDNEEFEELLNSKLKEIIKNYLNGQIVLGQKK